MIDKSLSENDDSVVYCKYDSDSFTGSEKKN